jgi:CPA1 family monovalent cation:H+ antiporter
MGIGIGLAIALVYYAIHRWLPTTPDIDIVLTLTAPYVMYIAAESLHFSGVLSVVSGSLFLSTRNYQILSHRSRLRGANVWSTIGFVLNGLVFILIGLELPEIVRQLGTVSLGQAIGYSVGITAVLIVARLLCTLGSSVFTKYISRYITTADSNPGWKGPLIVGWAGMRGVVSLAAALSIPYALPGGGDFPQRDLIIFITFMVIVLTLLIQGLTLPALISRLRWQDPDHQLTPEQQDLQIRKQLTAFSLAWLKEHCPDKIESNPLLKQLKGRYYADNVQLARESHDVQEEYKYYYLKLIKKERQFLIDLNKKLENDEEIIRKYQSILDLEQEKLLCLYEPED